MKRLYLTVVALLSMTMTFAGDKNGMDAAGANTAATSATMAKADSTASYDISYNLRRLEDGGRGRQSQPQGPHGQRH